MPIFAFILGGIVSALLAGAIVWNVLKIARLTIKKLKIMGMERRAKNKKVLFGKTEKLLNTQVEDSKDNTISMSELEDLCDENPYFFVDYDQDEDEISDLTFVQTEESSQVDDLVKEDGIVLFE